MRDIRDFYGEAGAEELDCIPRQSGGKYLPRALLEARAVKVPILRWGVEDSFVDLADDKRWAECDAWLRENVEPILSLLPSGLRTSLGEDFGRSGDLTVLWPLITGGDLVRRTPFVIELRNVPFRQQEQVVFWLIDRMPRFSGAAFDARGNGQYLAEVSRQRYGSECIAEVMLTEGWYREHMPPAKAALEDGTLELPADAEILDDFRTIEVVKGVPRVVEKTRGATGQRHGDAAVACVLSYFASRTLDAGPIRFRADGQRVSSGAYFGDPDLARRALTGW